MNNKILVLLTISIVISASCRKENHDCLKPVASFTDTVIGSAEEPVRVYFRAISTAKPEDEYRWDLGDGFKTFLMNPVHFYKFGKYWVILVQTSTSGVSDTAKKFIDINSAGSVTIDSSINRINFTYSSDSAAPYKVDLVNTSKNGVSYLWDFGDGTTTTIPSDTLSHKYPIGGTYKILLTVTGHGGVDSTSKTIQLQ